MSFILLHTTLSHILELGEFRKSYAVNVSAALHIVNEASAMQNFNSFRHVKWLAGFLVSVLTVQSATAASVKFPTLGTA